MEVAEGLYKMGHEKVARLPFWTCPCDILSGVSIYTVYIYIYIYIYIYRCFGLYRYSLT